MRVPGLRIRCCLRFFSPPHCGPSDASVISERLLARSCRRSFNQHLNQIHLENVIFDSSISAFSFARGCSIKHSVKLKSSSLDLLTLVLQ